MRPARGRAGAAGAAAVAAVVLAGAPALAQTSGGAVAATAYGYLSGEVLAATAYGYLSGEVLAATAYGYLSGGLEAATAYGYLSGGIEAATAYGYLSGGIEQAGRGTAAGLWLARLCNHAAFTALMGLLLAPAFVADDRGSGAPPPWARRLARPATGTALLWAASALALFAFGLSDAAARPLPEALTGDVVRRFAATRFGTAVLAQCAWAVVTATLALAATRRSSARRALAAAAFGGLGPAWWGHAAGAEPAALAVAGTWVHVVAAGAWIGGLGALVLALRAGAADLEPSAARFSRLAGVAIAAVAVTGVINVVVHTGAPAQLVDTAWGRLALVKTGALVVLAAIGYGHRRASLPRLAAASTAGGRALLGRLAAVELAVMLATVGLAATMASGLPAEAEAALDVQSVTAPLADGQVNVTVDPARAGRNELHLYVFDAGGGLRVVADARVTVRGPHPVPRPRLLPAGPGHFTAGDVRFPEPGTYTVEVRLGASGETATLDVVVR